MPQREPGIDVVATGPIRRLTAHLFDGIFALLPLVLWFVAILYLLWWLIVLALGQTPGKQLTGLVAVRRDGSRFGWGRMFIRECFKSLFWVLTLGIGLVVDAAFLLLSSSGRSVTDRVTGSTIVHISTLHS